jgi:quercetin dioxygenase-like cupin family protein
MPLYSWDEIPLEEMNPLVSRRVHHGAQMTVAQVFLKKGAVVPEHHHYHEQTMMLKSGKLVFHMGGEDILVEAGCFLSIEPNLPHSVTALEDSVAIDIFSPARDDWQRGEDAYLRQS